MRIVAKKKKDEDNIISDYIKNKKKDACKVIDRMMAEIGDPERIANAPLNQLSSAMGTLINTFGNGEKELSAEGTLATLFDDFDDVK